MKEANIHAVFRYSELLCEARTVCPEVWKESRGLWRVPNETVQLALQQNYLCDGQGPFGVRALSPVAQGLYV